MSEIIVVSDPYSLGGWVGEMSGLASPPLEPKWRVIRIFRFVFLLSALPSV
jgi:hypothetical protein